MQLPKHNLPVPADVRGHALVAVVTVGPVVLGALGRGTSIHVRVSAPMVGDTLPIILFSHGNGQSLHAYGPLTDYWTAHDFIVIQPTHLDSRTLSLSPDDPRRPQLWRFREQDLLHILDGLDQIESKVSMIQGRLDHARIAVAGHSTAFLRRTLFPDDPAWQEEVAALAATAAPEGCIEAK